MYIQMYITIVLLLLLFLNLLLINSVILSFIFVLCKRVPMCGFVHMCTGAQKKTKIL